jgi:hypothetical protein
MRNGVPKRRPALEEPAARVDPRSIEFRDVDKVALDIRQILGKGRRDVALQFEQTSVLPILRFALKWYRGRDR